MPDHANFTRMRCAALSLGVVALLVLPLSPRAVSWGASASKQVSEASEPAQQGLSELVAPIALYPDDLLALMLPASTFPIQVVQASRFLAARVSDETLQPDPLWDPSILALLNYPEALALLNEDLDWTWLLGEAVVADQGAVMQAVQEFRQRVHAAGNLESNEQHAISQQGDAILIEPADPKVIYVPRYRPSRVVVVHTGEPLYWYSSPYPYYYHPRAAYWSGFYFRTSGYVYGLSWGGYGLHHRHHVAVHNQVHAHTRRGDGHHSGSGDVWRPAPDQKMRGDRPGSQETRTAPEGIRRMKPVAGTGRGRGRGFGEAKEPTNSGELGELGEPGGSGGSRGRSASRYVRSERPTRDALTARSSRESKRASRSREIAKASVKEINPTRLGGARRSSKPSASDSTKQRKLDRGQGSVGSTGSRRSLFRTSSRASSSATNRAPKASKASGRKVKTAASTQRASSSTAKRGKTARKTRGANSNSGRKSSGRRGAKR